MALRGRDIHLVACGVIATTRHPTFTERLMQIHEELVALVREHEPGVAAVESVFHARNARSALKLGHARGAALLALARGGMPIEEYPPAQVKQALTGNGRADKEQVARMVRMIVGATGEVQADATDALAVAICHASMNPKLR